MDPWLPLINSLVTRAVIEHGSVHIDLGDSATLTIINNWALRGVSSVEALLGRKLLNVRETEDAVSLLFSEETFLDISLSPAAYNGPEAMILHRDGSESILVWN